jgi:hypothetical protein
MADDASNTLAPEPAETGTLETQEPGRPVVVVEPVLSNAPFELHGLPTALRELGTVFRSHPFSVILLKWTEEITKESDQRRRDLEQANQENKKLRETLEAERVENARLRERLKSLQDKKPVNDLIKALGGAALPFALMLYQEQQTFFAVILLIIGLFLLAFEFIRRGIDKRDA